MFPVAIAVTLTGCAGDMNDLFQATSTNVASTGSIDGTGSVHQKETGLVPGLPAGYRCPLVPNGFDPVGSIYRVNRSGTYFRVADLSNNPRILKTIRNNVPVGNYAFNHKEQASADLSVSLLKRVLPGFSGSARSNRQFNVDITVQKMHAKMLYDTEADYIRDWFAEKIRPKTGNRYFLVREAIFAGSVRYVVDSQDLKKAGVKAKVEEVIDSSANATFRDSDRKLVITQNFDPPTQVCMKVAEIEIDRRRSNGTVASAKLKPTSGASFPTIKRIGN
ncbi:MAG: hypothetical protein ACR2PG_03355 [Hyphomicrobiaceae bacterium]